MKNSIWMPVVLVALTLGCKKDQKISLAVLTTVAASNVTANSIQSGGNITNDGGTVISKKGIAWATHSGPTVGDSITIDGSGTGSFTSSLNSLNPNTTYFIKAYAINGSGTAYGNEVSFVTNKGVPTITTTMISNIVPLSAVSGGTIVNNGGVTVTARGLCYSTSPHPTISNFKNIDTGSTTSFSDTLMPLASQTNYYVRAYATNLYGTAYGNEVFFQASSANTVTDIDGNVYSYITIGTQAWMSSNLKTTHYRNGDSITNGSTGFDWTVNMGFGTVGAYAFPNSDSTNKAKFGLFYNSAAIIDIRNIAPKGWHIPSDLDWQVLEFNQGMSAADTGTFNFGRGASLGPKFLEGGSSGLNLQLAGFLATVGASSGKTIQFGLNAYYTTSTIFTDLNGPKLIYRTFYGPASPNYLNTINRNFSTYGRPIRCVKD